MAWALLLVVAGIWALFLLPPAWVDRRAGSVVPLRHVPSRTAKPTLVAEPSFNTPQSSGGVGVKADSGSGHASVLSRRRRVFLVLVVAVIGTLAASITLGGLWMIGLHVVVDVLLIWYVIWLRSMVKYRQEAKAYRFMLEQMDEAPDIPRVRIVQSG